MWNSLATTDLNMFDTIRNKADFDQINCIE